MPLYKEMPPEMLRRHYAIERGVLYRTANFSQHVSPHGRGANARAIARQWAAAQRKVELIERVADKRGISLTGPTD